MLDELRLKDKIRAAFNEQAEENDAAAAMNRISEKIAQAIIAEIKDIKITYVAGLTTSSGPVGGQFNYNIS
jgi:hypothetical protein